ncbi:MAG: hypothetical protein CL927_10415 [Deltaproteobacteria bacterium]|nr:hypothetical protein [Deltaproteobacteria bacterium]HCH65432.1 hypothetical protein [Deltaproteobacteria bacterium]
MGVFARVETVFPRTFRALARGFHAHDAPLSIVQGIEEPAARGAVPAGAIACIHRRAAVAFGERGHGDARGKTRAMGALPAARDQPTSGQPVSVFRAQSR